MTLQRLVLEFKRELVLNTGNLNWLTIHNPGLVFELLRGLDGGPLEDAGRRTIHSLRVPYRPVPGHRVFHNTIPCNPPRLGPARINGRNLDDRQILTISAAHPATGDINLDRR